MPDQGEERFSCSFPEREDAVALINVFRRALRELRLTNRFGVAPSPRMVRGNWAVYLTDRFPYEPVPEELSAGVIRKAMAAPEKPPKRQLVHGHYMTLQEAAAAVDVSDQSLRNKMRKDDLTLEEAVDFYALKKAS